MRRIFLLLLFTIATIAVNSQDFSGIKIFINPGHGGHDSDDRHIVVTDFWESESNLEKGLYLRDILSRMGAEIIMSRTQNRSVDDLPLSQISQMANENNVDYFHSIHSNGFTGTINYPLVLFRGYDNDPVFPEAKEMAKIMWTKLFENGTAFNYTNQNYRGDWSFYSDWGTQGLGVLRGLSMPGVLSEGSFHDYIPESWRLKNSEYLLREAWVFAKCFIEYYEKSTLNTAIVHGIVRDKRKESEYYHLTGTKDKYLPLNGTEVKLLPDEITYQCDELNNGYFLFDSIAPGDYKLVFSLEEYMNDTVDVSVTANQMLFIEEFLQLDTLLPPGVLKHYPVMLSATDSINATEDIVITFDRPMDTEATENAFSIKPEHEMSFRWMEDGQIMFASPVIPFEKATIYSVNITADAKHAWNVNLPGIYSFEFLTKNRNRLKLIDNFPSANADEIGNQLQFVLKFDAPLKQQTLINAVNIEDNEGNAVSITKSKITSDNGYGIYQFQPESPLKINTYYLLTLPGTISDEDGNPLLEQVEIPFTTISDEVNNGIAIYDFDEQSDWQDPDFSGSTTGTNTNTTSFRIWNYFKLFGTGSGRLTYLFTNNDGGVCRLFNGEKKSIGTDEDVEVGIWIFGDYSKNEIELWFFYNETENAIVSLGEIDWAGWAYKSFPYAEIGGSGERLLHSIVINQTTHGATSGTLYFDNAQIYSEELMSVPKIKKDSQIFCYPNPASSIVYLKETKQNGILRLMDITGKVIKTKKVYAINSTTSMDVSSLRAGLYFVSFTSNSGDVTTLKVVVK